MKFYFFPSDILFYVLLLFWIFLFFTGSKRDDMRLAWSYIASKPLAMIALAILMFYAGLTFLDCIHFKTATSGTKIFSALDYLLYPAGQNDEKSYSSPFSTHLLNYEFTPDKNGILQAVKPPLIHVTQHGLNLTELLSISFSGFIQAFLLCMILFSLFILLFKIFLNPGNLYNLIKDKSSIYFFSTFFILLLISCIIHQLLPDFHIFGTDKIGQDVFYCAIKSIRTGVLIGSLTTVLMIPLAVVLGTSAGYFGGWIDDIIQYLYTTLSSIPGVLLIAASMLSLQILIESHQEWFSTIYLRADMRLIALCFILGITSWTGLCRLLRAETLKIKELDFIAAAKVLGVKSPIIILRHIVPNVFHMILITLVLDFSGLVLAEVVLSYVGVGVDPSTMSWGNMINAARLELSRSPIIWWPLAASFTFMFILVLSANIFGDALEEAFDPRLRS